MNAVIVEDEGLAASDLRTILDEFGTIRVVATLESVAETIDWFQQHPEPDLLFLDIHLADGSAFQIFEHIAIRCPVIFTTAYDEYALKAFSVNSIDYLLKPIEPESVRRALAKLDTLKSDDQGEESIQKLVEYFKKSSAGQTHFLIPAKGDKLVPLEVKVIAYFHIDTGLVKAVTFDGRTFVMDRTLDELAGQLKSADFFRANRQYIIARSAIKDIDLWFNSRLSINLKYAVPEKILVSKARVPEFRNWFSGN